MDRLSADLGAEGLATQAQRDEPTAINTNGFSPTEWQSIRFPLAGLEWKIRDARRVCANPLARRRICELGPGMNIINFTTCAMTWRSIL